MLRRLSLVLLGLALGIGGARAQERQPGDWYGDAPGVTHRISASLPAPYATASASNGPSIVAAPAGVLPKVPAGFTVARFATGLTNPRDMRTAPNGDIFLAESQAGRIRIIPASSGSGPIDSPPVFATGLNRPFGIAFYPPGPDPHYVYVANTDSVVRFAYRSGDLKAAGAAETVVAELPHNGGHWTRSIVFSPDGKTLYVSVGSGSNDAEHGEDAERERADILAFTPEGKDRRIFALGLRNAVDLAIEPKRGTLLASVNERDGLGDDLPPDYFTRVTPGGFYGWPWFYIGDHPDPRHKGAHAELAGTVLTPDVLIQPHSAPLGIAVYTGAQFPAAYRGDVFVALHGSWNRAIRTGYKVVRVRMTDGVPSGAYEDFLTGFVASDGDVWGRPVGVTVAKDGALIVSDDASGTLWRVAYSGAK
jgi:glucose/arabinose dehydrogenase